MTTYTAEQIEAIGGRRWSKSDGILRVYLNDDVWAPMVGLDVSYYNTGNISGALLSGKVISNRRARQLLAIKVYWENGQIWITRDAELAGAIRKAIADAVANLDKPNDHDATDVAGTISALRSAGRTVRQIAEMVGVSVSTIYRWTRGICRPRPANAAALSAIA